MPETRSGGASRNVQHGNNVNKAGGTVPQFQQKAVVDAHRPAPAKKQPTPIPASSKTITEERTIVAEANKLPGSSP